MKLASFFAGCGGLDLGFEQAGFDVVWANEYDKSIYRTYQTNHPATHLCLSDIRELKESDIPDVDGFIGGPPCQSWSYGGLQLGLDDERGRLFISYIKLIKAKKPKFFVIENVDGIVSDKHFKVFLNFISDLESCGYNVYYKLLNAADYNIPQDRKRVFVVGFIKTLDCNFTFPKESDKPKIVLRKAIGDIITEPYLYHDKVLENKTNGRFYNHDCYIGPFDHKYMSRNRVRNWDEISFTIQAQARNCPIHPNAPKMEYIDSNHRRFKPGFEELYRRLSVRECARIQTFPDSFRFYYEDIRDGYKMVGNAVPPRLAYNLAISIKKALQQESIKSQQVLIGYYKNEAHLNLILKNNLYYVRTGMGRGAINLQPNCLKIKYLLLHNRNTWNLYELDTIAPSICTNEELENCGFKPSHKLYLTFRIKKKVELENYNNIVKLIKKGRMGSVPYIRKLEI